MNWRALLGVVAGLLLPLPLVLLLGEAMFPVRPPQLPGTKRVSPVLDVEERARRVTYHRDCKQGSDCEPPLACVSDPRHWLTYCTDSQCMTDAQCPEGQLCRSVASEGEGPLVRLCVPEGTRQEGERCQPLPNQRQQACGPGLLCGGSEGWCARPCTRGEGARCPEGFFCADVAPQPMCLPTCESRGCPAGQQCLRYEEGVSACAAVDGTNCQQTPCPQGSACRMLDSLSQRGRVWMECVRECDVAGPACPTGEVCHLWRCQKPCEPHRPGACGEGFRCEQHKPEGPWVCGPAW